MKILLTTLHAKYVHASLALPCIAAACRDLPDLQVEILELTVNEQQDRSLARIHAAQADVVLFSCYIWNQELTLKLASDLKKLQPNAFLVLGGPEASFGAFETMERTAAIDCIVRGEGEATCRALLQALQQPGDLSEVAGITYRDNGDIVANPEREPIALLDSIASPFAAGMVDVSKPLVYLETSRGCPFSCAFCLSSTEKGVRSFSMERIKADFSTLLAAGARTVKLVDRTFNYDAQRALEIWRFLLERNAQTSFHFEVAAQLLTDEHLALLSHENASHFRFEMGVQSAGEDTLAAVARNSDVEKLLEKVRRLLRETPVTVHLDLVAGLPGETFAGFLGSVQRLIDLEPHHIQVEVLKVLKGTPMRGIAREEGYAFAEAAPYKLLQNRWLSFGEIRRIEGVSRLLDLLYNSGRFTRTLQTLAQCQPLSQMLAAAADFFEENDLGGSLSLARLFEAVWSFALATRLLDDAGRERVRDALTFDFCLTGYPGSNTPDFFLPSAEVRRQAPAAFPAPRAGERVRHYRRVFARDYRHPPWEEGMTPLTFVYRSANGAGLQVEICEDPS